MSGIVGLYCLDGRPVARADVERMVDTLAHRGPDGSGVWHAGMIGLGHRLLWTTPESLYEQLPLAQRAGALVVTADIRLDNREDLLATLALTGYSPEKITDSQVLLAAYKKWGTDCPEQLLGDFAFAIWDRHRKVLFCARDHFGAKPFYYYQQPGRVFAFASEIKGLLCLPEVPCRLNELRVAFHLQPELLLQDKTITFYRDIYRLPPGHSLTVTPAGMRWRAYWSLDPMRELRLKTDEEYAEAFGEIFTDAVRCRLRSAFPVGSTLSGGLDSSSITCVARDLLVRNGKPLLHTFSAIFDEVPQADERSFIQAVLAQGNVKSHFTHPDQLSPLVDLDRVFWHLDEAFFGPNYFLPWSLYRTAGAQSVRVLMDGTDGDTTVSHGTDYLVKLARAGRWAAFAAEAEAITQRFHDPGYATCSGILQAHGLPHLSELARQGRWLGFARGVHEVGRRFGVSRRDLLLHHGLRPLAHTLLQRVWGMPRRYHKAGPKIPRIINREFAARIALGDRIEALESAQPTPLQTPRTDHYRFLTSGALPYSLELTNRLSAAFAVELRYPFCDKRVAEFCLALPPEQKLQGGWSRLVMRKAMTNMLPVEVQWRGGKANLAPVYNRGLLTFEHRLLEEVVFQTGSSIEEYVDMPTLREAYHRYVSQNSERDRMWVWIGVILAVWLRRTGLKP